MVTQNHLYEEVANPIEQPLEKVLLVFEGAMVYGKYFEKFSERLTNELATKGVNTTSFYKGVMAYGQANLKEEDILLRKEIAKFQPKHILYIKQVQNLVYHSSVKNPLVYDSGKRSNSQFEITLKTSLMAVPLWKGNLEITTPKGVGNKIDKLTVIKASRNIMGTLYRNDYIR